MSADVPCGGRTGWSTRHSAFVWGLLRFHGQALGRARIDLLDRHIAGDLGALFLSGGTEYDFE